VREACGTGNGPTSTEVGDGSEGEMDESTDAGMVPVPVVATMAGSAY
jgi:hypothetical protein